MAFKLSLPKFTFPKPSLGSSFSTLKSVIRFIVMKIIGVALSVVFLTLGVVFLGYTLVSTASNLRGEDAKIVSALGQVGKHHTSFRLGGLFEVTAEMNKKKYGKIYCLYPAWPDTFT